MATYTRRNAWNSDGNFSNPDLFWYAKAVSEMQSRPISDPTSWWFYAAIHGQFLTIKLPPQYSYLEWQHIAYIPPAAHLNHLPAPNQVRLFWDQCQHGTWFFPPWHRGYLVALENILREIIVGQLQGPSDWALPYWNYLKDDDGFSQAAIPPAFTAHQMPDGSKNPLFVEERYGPDGNGNIYVQVGANPQTSANDECQWDIIYSESIHPAPTGVGNLYGYYYGGSETGFSHSNDGFGDLESNPHNFVHGMVGGRKKGNSRNGLMGVPATAALDPIFYLHNANIDRMWAAWNTTGNNPNPTDPNWLTGPSANGN